MSENTDIKWTTTVLPTVLPDREKDRKSVGNRIPHRVMTPTTVNTEMRVGTTIKSFAPAPKHPRSCECHTCRLGARDMSRDGDIQWMRDRRKAKRAGYIDN